MIGSTFAIDMRSLIPLLAVLFLFGCGYAWAVYWLGERKAGYVSLFVALGVLVTLGLEAFVDSRAALLSLMCFVASGTPMIIGDVAQHMSARDRSIKEKQQQADDKIDKIREMSRDDRP